MTETTETERTEAERTEAERTEAERTEAERTEAILAGTLHALDAVLLVTVRVARTRDGLQVGAYGLPGIRPDVRRSILRAVSESLLRAADAE